MEGGRWRRMKGGGWIAFNGRSRMKVDDGGWNMEV